MNREPTWGRQIIAAVIALGLVLLVGSQISCTGGGSETQEPAPTQTEVTEPSPVALAMVGKTYTTVQTVQIEVNEIGGDVALISWRINGNQQINDVPVDLAELVACINDGPSAFVETITETTVK